MICKKCRMYVNGPELNGYSDKECVLELQPEKDGSCNRFVGPEKTEEKIIRLPPRMSKLEHPTHEIAFGYRGEFAYRVLMISESEFILQKMTIYENERQVGPIKRIVDDYKYDTETEAIGAWFNGLGR